MDVIVQPPAALDVHNATVMACVRVPGTARRRAEHIAEFHTTVHGLLALRDWPEEAHAVEQFAMGAAPARPASARSGSARRGDRPPSGGHEVRQDDPPAGRWRGSRLSDTIDEDF